MTAVKLLLAAEAVWFGTRYIQEHTASEQRPVMEQAAYSDVEKEVYGVGFEADSGFFFWFHSRTEDSGGN